MELVVLITYYLLLILKNIVIWNFLLGIEMQKRIPVTKPRIPSTVRDWETKT